MKTGIYLRISTDSQSTDSQRDRTPGLLRAPELAILADLRGCNQRCQHSRPGLDALMSDVRAGKVERLLVFKLDRLGRSLGTWR